MKSYSRIVAILLIMFPLGVSAQPQIKAIPGTEFSFGKIYKGTTAVHTMAIKNVGTDTLIITDVFAQCGCTATMMSTRKLAPAESGSLSISFSTAGYDGRVTKHVYIDSNDSTMSELEIEFSADIVQSLKPEPSSITFNVTRPDSTYISEITLTNTTFEAIKILSFKTAFVGLNIQFFKNELMPGEQTVVQASLLPKRLGSYRGSVIFKTDHAAQPNVEIGVFELYRP